MTSPDAYQPLTSDDGRYRAFCGVVAIPDGYHAMDITTIEVQEADGTVVARATYDYTDLTPVRFLTPTRLIVRSVLGWLYEADIAAQTLTQLGREEPAGKSDAPLAPAAPRQSAEDVAAAPGEVSEDRGRDDRLPAVETPWRRGASPGSERWFYVVLLVLSVAMVCIGVASALDLMAGGTRADNNLLIGLGIVMTVLFAVMVSLRNETVVDPVQRVVVQEVRSALHRWRRVSAFDRFQALRVRQHRHRAVTFYLVTLEGDAIRVVLFGARNPDEAMRTARGLAEMTGVPLEASLG